MNESIEELIRTNHLLLERLKFEGGKFEGGTTHGGDRDLYEIFGYKRYIKPYEYRFMYERGHVASRIATAYPDAVWSNPPQIIEDEESQDDTEFEKQFKELAKKTKLWHYIHRADTLAQLGRFSVLYFGVADGKEITEPVGTGKIDYMMPFGETHAEIQTTVTDKKDPRYGMPETYCLTIDSETSDGDLETITVHASRCLHIAERLLDNNIYGTSILKPIFNKLEDLEKVSGGGAEVWWMNSRGGLNINADKDAEIVDPEDVKQQIDEYLHKLTRVIRTRGMDVRTLDQNTSSPRDQVSVLLELISGSSGIPKRILVGSERGELASTQDEDNWASRVDERRTLFCEPCVMTPLIDFFIQIGALKEPKQWAIEWPDLITLSDEKKASIAVNKATALATYSNAIGADMVIPPEQFIEEILCEEYREEDIRKAQEQENKEIDEARRQSEVEEARKQPEVDEGSNKNPNDKKPSV